MREIKFSKLLIYFIFIIVSMVIGYLAFAYILLETDIFKWGYTYRQLFVLINLGILALGVPAANLIKLELL